ncbi:D-alanyl-D-alanine carboxypeptidase/D-alanyl-D-alanine endopeptidase [Conexibacter woesei]|uniref:D-alanyl-D-alaninecarboxypeptidase/D-alanyl-D-alanine-endopeptidase n=1 Tax=Conexibacter woesei (strain DSM 14684 / CCUG 47730 / CIP 108061 / JCM 11494 / NBRC 100937 / ID131577) TaxID=469383 RepID=D3EYT9_CONWI|nr:D-alanyl-D-alanine carboxypeptidase/D-alanyl-D-alanine-endopeptidase [Conexibacter woesei]ADB49813.1 D-alanyl-D-alaninecarboxypeptidase/D-alanyl-D-alanine-endopeptidase [Conexibacter woesei DSM 14684]
MRRIALLASLAALAAPAAAPLAATAAPLDGAVSRELSRGGGVNGAYVLNMTTGSVLASVRADTARIPASVEKLYTTSTALLRYGADGTLDTRVLGSGALEDDGTWRGDLYLRGSGDPTFGSARYTQYAFGGGATVTDLAAAVAEAGITRVSGRVYGDESFFDSKRGGPASSYGFDVWIGSPLTGLLYNRGLAKEDGSALQKQPALFAAQQLTTALRQSGVRVARAASSGIAPTGAEQLASIPSLPMSTLARLTLVPSDNLLAEMLLKGVGASFGTAGSTAAGATVARSTLSRFGISPRLADGSGLSRANATSPRQVVQLLDGMRDQAGFRSGMPVAGRSGTLMKRVRGTIAQDNCQAKTGTLSNVSALGGYCRSSNGHQIAFAFMFNSVSTYAAKAAEDRLMQLLARQRPTGTAATRTKREARAGAVRSTR